MFEREREKERQTKLEPFELGFYFGGVRFHDDGGSKTKLSSGSGLTCFGAFACGGRNEVKAHCFLDCI